MSGLIKKFFGKKQWKADRIASKSVTDVLLRAMEKADDMKLVLVVYEAKNDSDSAGGVFVQEDTTLSSINWMLDQAKKWVIE